MALKDYLFQNNTDFWLSTMDSAITSFLNATPYPEMLQNDSFKCLLTSTDTYHYHGLPVVVPLSTLMIIFIILSVVGNTMVIITIVRHRGMRTRTNMFIINLAVADICVAVLDMPVSLVTVIHGDWFFSKALCKFNGFTMALFLICSIHTLMYISIHKYISITRPFSRAMTPRRIRIMIAATWVWSFLCATGPLVGWNEIVYKRGSSQCGPNLPRELVAHTHSLFNTTFNYLIPLGVMSFCYFNIFKEIRQHMRRIRETSNINLENSVEQQKRIAVTLFWVLACFFICWTPFIIYSTTLAFSKNKCKVPLIANPLAYWCGYMNSACNPIIYAFRSPSFRQGYREIICRPPSQTTFSVNSMSFRSKSIRGSLKSTSQSFNQSAQASTRKNTDARGKRKRFLSETSWMSLPFIPFSFKSRSSTNSSEFGHSKKRNRSLSRQRSSGNNCICVPINTPSSPTSNPNEEKLEISKEYSISADSKTNCVQIADDIDHSEVDQKELQNMKNLNIIENEDIKFSNNTESELDSLKDSSKAEIPDTHVDYRDVTLNLDNDDEEDTQNNCHITTQISLESIREEEEEYKSDLSTEEIKN